MPHRDEPDELDALDELDQRLAAARQAYAERRPNSAAAHERAREVLPGGSTRTVLDVAPFPFKVAHASGARLRDVDGHEYVDMLGDYSAGLLGHAPQAVAAAVAAALADGWSFGATHEAEATLAQLVCDRFPSIDQVRFTNSGTEANLMAIVTARHVTGRSKIVVFEGAYHGALLMFGPGGKHVRAPFPFVVATYNDLGGVAAAFAEHSGDIAAVLVEPMLGAGGCIPADPGFLDGLRTLTDDHGALLIFDEVMTSRMSSGGAQLRLGITPDMTTLGKYLAGGMTFGAFGGRSDVMAAFDPARGGAMAHGGTFNNNVVTLAAGIEVLSNHLHADVLDALFAAGEELRDSINGRLADAGLPAVVSGWGSLLTVHPVPGPVRRPADVARVDRRLRELIYFGLVDRGFYISPRGYLAMSLALTAADIDAFRDALVDVMSSLQPILAR